MPRGFDTETSDVSGYLVDEADRMPGLLDDDLSEDDEGFDGEEDDSSEDEEDAGGSSFFLLNPSDALKSELQKRLTLRLRPALPETIMPKSERVRMVSQNPVLAVTHYYQREAALWSHGLNGKHRPLDNIGTVLKRRDGLQRGSNHTHCMIGSDPKNEAHFTSVMGSSLWKLCV
jgi:hypothetical protein